MTGKTSPPNWTNCIDALQKADVDIKQQESLPLATEGVETELDRYYDHKHQLVAKVETMHEQCEEQKARYEQLDEAMPLELTEKIEEFETLRESVLAKLNKQVSHQEYLLVDEQSLGRVVLGFQPL